MAVNLTGKVALVTGELSMRATCSLSNVEHIMTVLPAGSTQGIGFGMIRGLAAAGADIVMHGLVDEKELKDKTAALAKEFDVRVGHSSANVRKPQEIRHAGCTNCCNAALATSMADASAVAAICMRPDCAALAAGTCSPRHRMTWVGAFPSSATM